MGRPVVCLVLGALFMLALSLPYWFQAHPDGEGRGIKTGLAGIGTLPDGIQTKQAFDLLVQKFPKAGLEATADIVIEADARRHAGRAAGSTRRTRIGVCRRGGHPGDLDRRRSQPGDAGAATGERRRHGGAGVDPARGRGLRLPGRGGGGDRSRRCETPTSPRRSMEPPRPSWSAVTRRSSRTSSTSPISTRR